MNIHKNAGLTPIGRERLVMAVLSGQSPEVAARVAGVCLRTRYLGAKLKEDCRM